MKKPLCAVYFAAVKPSALLVLFCVCISLFLFTTNTSMAQCTSTTGATDPGAVTGQGFPGSDFSIFNPSNAITSDNSYGTAAALVTVLSGQTDYVMATNFNFNLPAESTICGIVVGIEKSATGIGLFSWVKDNAVYLIKNGSVIGTNKANASNWTGTDAYSTYGGTIDSWGTTWRPADINASNFGVAISADMLGIVSALPTARIDHIRVTVHYEVWILPVHIIDFKVTARDGLPTLQWSTSDHKASAIFMVERSADGSNWETIDSIRQTAINNYIYRDLRPLNGKSFYRLQVKNDEGHEFYTAVKPFVTSGMHQLKLYPNPVNSHARLFHVQPDARIRVSDILGRTYTLPYSISPAGTLDMNFGALKAGTYFLQVDDETYQVRRQ